MKKLCALLLMLGLLYTAALAEYAVEVDWYGGKRFIRSLACRGCIRCG